MDSARRSHERALLGCVLLALAWAAVAFLFTFAILVIAVCYYFLFPALQAAKTATPQDKAKLRAYSALLLAIILVVLICGTLLTVRIGRFFFSGPAELRSEDSLLGSLGQHASGVLIQTRQQQLSAIVNTYQALGGGAALAVPPPPAPPPIQEGHKFFHFFWKQPGAVALN